MPCDLSAWQWFTATLIVFPPTDFSVIKSVLGAAGHDGGNGASCGGGSVTQLVGSSVESRLSWILWGFFPPLTYSTWGIFCSIVYFYIIIKSKPMMIWKFLIGTMRFCCLLIWVYVWVFSDHFWNVWFCFHIFLYL